MHLKYPILDLHRDRGVGFGDLVEDAERLLRHALVNPRRRPRYGPLVCQGMHYIRVLCSATVSIQLPVSPIARMFGHCVVMARGSESLA